MKYIAFSVALTVPLKAQAESGRTPGAIVDVGTGPKGTLFETTSNAMTGSPVQQDDRSIAIESAKSHFRTWAAKVAGVPPGQVIVSPAPGKKRWKYSELDVGALFALEAIAGERWEDTPDLNPPPRRVANILRAFAGANGDLVALRDRQGFAPLARALRIMDTHTEPDTAARHVAYLFGREAQLATSRFDFPGFIPNSFEEPVIKRSENLAALVFFTFESGRTGSIDTTRHVLLTEQGYSQAELKSEKAL